MGDSVHPCPSCGRAMFGGQGYACSQESRVFVDDYFEADEPVVHDQGGA